MRFPLADWIDEHLDCRHNLGSSGMRGSIAHPRPNAREVGTASPERLTEALALGIRVDPRRVFLTHGATEANSLVTWFRRRAEGGAAPKFRVQHPEYPPLSDVATWAGFRAGTPNASAALGLVSLPRNPEGVQWSDAEFETWASGAKSLLVDETFREFSGAGSRSTAGRPGLWVTGTFTKFFAADDVRVGYVVAPPEESARFARFHGVVTDELPPYSVAAAVRILEDRVDLARRVRELFERNRRVLSSALPPGRAVRAPVFFDRVADGDRLARRCLRASILVCPGRFFGARGGVRLSLTRRTFPADFAAYLRVRNSATGRSGA
ncbi:MAG: aminotransferase class I/II-fold pyridoxal phosphate-dependent enzyme [Thermoplasmata archaeon]|nr:aminotransferase class I/II-fold pyridoxal phosphate-dependent enzyme [Thermoplasmata archaeon]